jgi:uncharacterized phage infection (PIP) family protein YhgE
LADKGSYEIIMNRSECCTPEFMALIRYLSKLRVHIKNRLLTTVEDEANNRSKLHDLTEKVRRNEDIRDVLQSKLDAVKDEKSKVITSLGQILRKLEHEEEDLKTTNRLELDTILKDTTEAISKSTSDHEVRMHELQDKVDALGRQLAEVQKENRQREDNLRTEKNKAEKRLNKQLADYDDGMETKRNSQEEISMVYETEKAEYALLKEHFDRVDSDNRLFAEEELILGAVRRRQEYALQLLDKAATKIQSLFRRKFSRDILKLKDKLSKKKKKGGGSKKKKDKK